MHRIAIVFVVAAAVLWLVFGAAQQHADNTLVPRFCKNPDDVISKVELILTKKNPVGEGEKRPFIIAAKLIFLIPQMENEDTENYVARLRAHLDKTCR